jgi:hypothetical protein
MAHGAHCRWRMVGTVVHLKSGSLRVHGSCCSLYEKAAKLISLFRLCWFVAQKKLIQSQFLIQYQPPKVSNIDSIVLVIFYEHERK